VRERERERERRRKVSALEKMLHYLYIVSLVAVAKSLCMCGGVGVDSFGDLTRVLSTRNGCFFDDLTNVTLRATPWSITVLLRTPIRSWL
jgi:hypothetical protein